jgi:death-on-curing protein
MIETLTASGIRMIHDDVMFEGELRGEYPGRLENMLARIEHRIVYQIGVSDLFDIAGCYGAFLASAHCFMDGNKRTAFRAADLFLAGEGCEMQFDSMPANDLYDLFIGCATGQSDEQQLSTFLRARFILVQAT